ncbi:hypothetical protein [Terrihalobacillus insolitus]|nr:hypothetical protein [Terrihalobacillus insolitus]
MRKYLDKVGGALDSDGWPDPAGSWGRAGARTGRDAANWDPVG